MVSQIIRSSTWTAYQEQHLLTDESFQEIDSFREVLKQGVDINALELSIAPALREGLDIAKIESKELTGKHWYARYGSTACVALEAKLAALEAGYASNHASEVGAVVFDCGMSAICSTLDFIIKQIPIEKRSEKKFLVANTLYYRTSQYFNEDVLSFGLKKSVPIDMLSLEFVEKYLQENSQDIIALFLEPLSNPLIESIDVRSIALIAHRYNVPVIVDNTLLTAQGQQSFRLGADVIINSLSKYVSGKGDIMGGVVTGPIEFMKDLHHYRSRGGILSPSTCIEYCSRLEDFDKRMAVYNENMLALFNQVKQYEGRISLHYPFGSSHYRDGIPGGVCSFSFEGTTLDEKMNKEKAFMEAIVHLGGPIRCKTSFGDLEYGALGQSTFGYTVPEKYAGLIRLSAGPGNVEKAQQQLCDAFTKCGY